MIKRILKTLLHMVCLCFVFIMASLVAYFIGDYAPIVGVLLFFGLMFWISWESVKSKERKDKE